MEQYHYIWIAKSVVILLGFVTLHLGYRLIKGEIHDNYVFETSLGKYEIGITGGSLGCLVMVFGIILALVPLSIPIPFEYEIKDGARELVGKPIYIQITRAVVICYGIFVLINGYRLLKKNYRNPYEIVAKAGPLSFKLQGTSVGIFVILLSIILVLGPLIIEPPFEHEIHKKEIIRIKKDVPPSNMQLKPIKNPDKLENDINSNTMEKGGIE